MKMMGLIYIVSRVKILEVTQKRAYNGVSKVNKKSSQVILCNLNNFNKKSK